MIYRVTMNKNHDWRDSKRNHHPMRGKKYFVRDENEKYVGRRSPNGIIALKNLDGVIIDECDFDENGDLERLALILRGEGIEVSNA